MALPITSTAMSFSPKRIHFTAEAARKPLLRNQQFGGDAGGPIVKDRVFFFVNFERQQYTIQVGSGDTEPVAAYVTEAQNLLAAHKVAVSPLSVNLLKLWPAGNATGYTAGQGNYTETNPSHGNSNNAIGNINWNISDRQSLRLQSFVGTGRQFAPVVTPSTYWYYQVAPDITQNFSATHNWAITSHFSNQLLAAVGIFNQTFNDENHSWNMPSLGLADGVTSPSLFGSPTISISDSVTFDEVGATQPIGRKDYTGHVTDAATWVHGRHQIRFGGEFRRNYIDLQYQSGVRGNFSFSGAASANVAAALATSGGTPWATSSGAFLNSGDATIAGNHTEVLALADFLSGYFTKASFIQGYLRRSLYQKSVSFFAQDQFQASTDLTLNSASATSTSEPSPRTVYFPISALELQEQTRTAWCWSGLQESLRSSRQVSYTLRRASASPIRLLINSCFAATSASTMIPWASMDLETATARTAIRQRAFRQTRWALLRC